MNSYALADLPRNYKDLYVFNSIFKINPISADTSLLASNSPTLPAGRYHYPFQFLLPSWLASSFEGAHGHVRYWMKAVIDKPWKFDHTVKRAFTVLGMLDLNKVDDAAVQYNINILVHVLISNIFFLLHIQLHRLYFYFIVPSNQLVNMN